MANESISVLNTKEYAPPKKGQIRTYQLLGLGIDPDNGSFLCPQSHAVPNKYLLNDKDDKVKSYVYVSHLDPSISSDNIPISQRGKIIFTREARGEIQINGDLPEQYSLDQALFFHQNNESNKGKSWHVKPKYGEYFFKMLDKKRKAELNVNVIERNQECVSLIKGMSIPNLRDTYEMIYKTSSEGLSQSEVKQALYSYVGNDDNAKAFLTLEKSEQMRIKRIISAAYGGKHIEQASNGNAVVWSKGKEVLCNKLPNKSIEQSMITYLVTDEGRQVLETLKELTEAKK